MCEGHAVCLIHQCCWSNGRSSLGSKHDISGECAGSATTWEEEKRSLQGAVHGLDLLSFVNTGPHPPEPWVNSYALFRKGLEPYLDALPEPQAARAIAETLTLAWWTSLLARLHINVFRSLPKAIVAHVKFLFFVVLVEYFVTVNLSRHCCYMDQ